MTGLASELECGVGAGSAEAFGNAPIERLTWLVGLIATVYLIGNASFLLFLSVAFMDYSSSGFAWWRVADIGRSSLPLFGFAAVGFAGLKLWPHGRLRLLGLLAIVFQTAMATWVYADPVGVIDVLFSAPFS